MSARISVDTIDTRTALSPMAMGNQKRHAKRASMWVATQRFAAHPFYARLNQILDEHEFDGYVEGLCERFYADDGRQACHPAATSAPLSSIARFGDSASADLDE